MELNKVASEHSAALFRFAWALTGEESAAVELTRRVLASESSQRHAASESRAAEVALFTAAWHAFTSGVPLPVPPAHERIAVMDQLSLHHASNLTAETLLKSFRELELPQRAALVLFYTTHCSLREIATVLHRSEDETVAVIARGKAEWLHILQRDGTSSIAPAKEDQP